MAANNFYEVRFIWPHTEPNSVIVTGTFDDWSASTHLTKTPSGFEGTTKIPWGQKIKYKFVVDGQWITHEDQPTETDPGGFINNVFTAPLKPAELEPAPTAIAPAVIDSVALETPIKEAAEPVTNGHATNGHTVATQVAEEKPTEPSAAPQREAASPEHKEGENSTSAAPNLEPKDPAGYPRLLADLADTIVARDGTSSALDYVASGLGAAMHSVVGVDPINIQKIPIPTPKPDDAFTLPAGQESAPNTADLPPEPAPPTTTTDPTGPDSFAPTFAPVVPIMLQPVNAPENNTEAAASASGTPAGQQPAAVADVASKEPEPSTHVPAVGDAPAVTELEAKAEPIAEQVAPEVPSQEVGKEEAPTPEPVPAPVAENPALGVKEKPSGTATSNLEQPVTEAMTEESAAPEQTAASEEPAAGEKKEEPSVPEPTTDVTKAPESAVVPPIEEVVTEVKTEEAAKEDKVVAVEAPVEEKPTEPSVQEPAPMVAVSEHIAEGDAEKPVKEEPAPISSVQGPSTEVKPEEAGLAVAVPPPKEVAVVEPVPVVQPTPTPDVEESKSEGLKEEHVTPTPIVGQVAVPPVPEAEAEGAPIFTQAEETTSAPQKEAAELTAQTSTEPAQPAVEAAPEAKEEAPATKPDAAPAPVEKKPATFDEAVATPAKHDQSFPSTSESPSTTGSPSSSRFNSTRKKRTSIFGKLKNIFHHDKEKEKDK